MTGTRTAPPRSEASCRDVYAVAGFRILFTENALLVSAETITMLTLSVLVYQHTGAPLLAALAYLAGFVPQALGGGAILALADRRQPRLILVATDLIRSTALVVLAVGPPALVMIVVVAAVGVLAPVSSAARGAILADLLTEKGYAVGRSIFGATAASAQVGGFTIGGALLGLAGPTATLLAAAAAIGCAATLVRIGIPARLGVPPDPTAAESVPSRSLMRTTWRGNTALLADPTVRGILLAQWLPVSFAVGAESLLVPYAINLGQPGAASTLLAASAIGMLAGNILVGRWLRADFAARLPLPLAVLATGPLLSFVAGPPAVPAACVLAVAGIGIAYGLQLQQRMVAAVPPAARARIIGLCAAGLTTGQGLAALGAGGLAQVLPIHWVIALAGAAGVLAAIALARHLAVANERS